MRVAVLFSGGKDSTYSLHWAYLKGFNISCLVTLEPRSEESWMFHYPTITLTRLQAKALNLPQIYVKTKGKKDEELRDLKKAIEKAIKRHGINGVVSGALLSDYQRMNINMICEELNLRCYSPFWRKNQEMHLIDLIDFGFEIVITGIYTHGLDRDLLGKKITKKIAYDIIRRARKMGFNPAFEGGEAETFVTDAPLFKRKIEIVRGRIVELNTYAWRYVIEDARLVEKI